MSTGFYNVRRNSVFSAVFFRAVRKIESDWSKDPQQSNRVHPNKYSLGNSPSANTRCDSDTRLKGM